MVARTLLPKYIDHLLNDISFEYSDLVIESKMLVNYEKPIFIKNIETVEINNVSIPVICDDVICFFNKNFRVATQIRKDFYSMLYHLNSELCVFKNFVTDLDGNLLLIHTIENNVLNFYVSSTIFNSKNNYHKKLFNEIINAPCESSIITDKYIVIFNDKINIVKKYIPKTIFNVKEYIVKSFERTNPDYVFDNDFSTLDQYISYLKGEIDRITVKSIPQEVVQPIENDAVIAIDVESSQIESASLSNTVRFTFNTETRAVAVLRDDLENNTVIDEIGPF